MFEAACPNCVQAAVAAWLQMYRDELGDSTVFNYFVDTGFWSKYGFGHPGSAYTGLRAEHQEIS